MRAQPPVVDDLYTRCLERGELIRVSVQRAEVLEAGAGSVVLATEAEARHALTDRLKVRESSAALPAIGSTVGGRVRIDVVAPAVVRVRYAEGDSVPDHRTPMLVGEIGRDAGASIETASHGVTIATGGMVLDVSLQPFSIRARTATARTVCRVGGADTNHWGGMGIVWDACNTGVCRASADAAPLAVECFALHPNEAIYGFGEKFIRLDKVGQTIDLNMVEALGVTSPRSYKNVPFFMSTHGYGVFFHHSARMTCWVGSRSAADLQVAIEDDFLDYFLIFGDLKQILSRYTDLTGKAQVPPKWSFGYWQSKISYSSAEESLEVAREMRAADLPMDVLHLDTHWFKDDWYCDLEFDRDRFPDPAAFLRELADLGVKVSLWQLPYIPEGCRLYDDLAEAGAFVRNREGEIYDIGIAYTASFEGRVGCIDWTNPAARRVTEKYFRRLFELGARVIKADFGEQAPLDGVYHDGTPGHRAHNLYPLLYNRAIAEMTAAATGEWIIWARSAWAGSQRYPLHWGGDSSANWDNMVPQIEGGLSLGMSGFSFWSQDIGGFVGQPDGALLIRWLQAGLLLSHARIHGFGDRELYKFEGDVQRLGREMLHLRYRLLPYLWGAAIDSARRSLPMARPLVLEFQDDPNTWRIGDQWLLGDHLLVAPIFDETNRRAAYLPAGTWTDWWTGGRHPGGRWIECVSDLATFPLFVREGGIVPLGPVMSYVDERPTDVVSLRIAPFSAMASSSFRTEVDGEPVEIHYELSPAGHRVSVTPSRARFEIESVGADAPAISIAERAPLR